MLDNELNYLKAAILIKNARSIVILAGAGMSADSGINTYENADDFVKDFPQLKNAGIETYKEMAQAKWFSQNPDIAWIFANASANRYFSSKPHPGYELIKEWLDSKHTSFIVTTNVDGGFRRSGYNNLLEIHGSHSRLQRTNNCKNEVWVAERGMNSIPKCVHCDVTARPNILYFNDKSFCTSEYNEQRQQYRNFLTHSNIRKPIAIEIGAGTTLPILRHESLKFDNVIRINPDPNVTHSNESTLHIKESAYNALQRLDELIT